MRPSAAAQLGLSLGKRFVAQALASRRSPGARNGSSGAALADARLWAEAGAGPFAELASWQRSEPSISPKFPLVK